MLLRHRWKLFAGIIFDPPVLILVAAVVLGHLWASNQTRDVTEFVNVVLNLTSALAATIAVKHWTDHTGDSVILARGKVAIRGLESIHQKLASLQERVSTFLSQHSDIPEDKLLTETHYEEIVEASINLQSDVHASIDNWQDISPHMQSNIRRLSELQKSLRKCLRSRWVADIGVHGTEALPD